MDLYPELTLSRVQLSVDSLTPGTASDLSLSAYLTLGEYQAPLQIQTEIIPTAAFDGITIRQTSINLPRLNVKYDGYLSGSNSGQFSGRDSFQFLNSPSDNGWEQATYRSR